MLSEIMDVLAFDSFSWFGDYVDINWVMFYKCNLSQRVR